MSRRTEEYIAPNFEKLDVQINHENERVYSLGSIEVLRGEKLVSHLGFEVNDVNFDQSRIEIYLPQIDTLSPDDYGKGYGSLALRTLIRYAIDLKATKISGSIWIDGDPKQLEAFYKKNFATLNYSNGKPTYFSIELTNPELLLAQIEKDFYKKRASYLEPYRRNHEDNTKFVADLASKNQNAHWLVKLAKRIVGEEK